jgi:hypothetical protein
MSAWHAPQCAHSAAAPKSLRWLKTGRCGQPVAACAAHACASASLTRGSEPPSALRSSRTPPQAQSTTPRRQSRRRVKQTGQGTGSSPDASGAPHSSCSSAAAAAAASSAATAASYSASAAASAQMEIRDEGVSQRECKTEAINGAGPRNSVVAHAACNAERRVGPFARLRRAARPPAPPRGWPAARPPQQQSAAPPEDERQDKDASAVLPLEPPRRCMPAVYTRTGSSGAVPAAAACESHSCRRDETREAQRSNEACVNACARRCSRGPRRRRTHSASSADMCASEAPPGGPAACGQAAAVGRSC